MGKKKKQKEADPQAISVSMWLVILGQLLVAWVLCCCCGKTLAQVVIIFSSLFIFTLDIFNSATRVNRGSGQIKASTMQCSVALLLNCVSALVSNPISSMSVNHEVQNYYGADGTSIEHAEITTTSFGVMDVIAIIVPLVLFIASIFIAVRAIHKDDDAADSYANNQRALSDKQREEAIKAKKHENQMMIENAASDIAKQKLNTAKAVEKSKTRAVKTASAAATVGGITKPKQSIDYANASGALAEGKAIADKLSERALGDVNAVADVDYEEVADTMKDTMSDEDSVFLESVKTLSKEALFQLLVKGAQNFGIDADGREIQEIAQDIIDYSPAAIKESIPDGLDNERQAAFLIEKMGVTPDEK